MKRIILFICSGAALILLTVNFACTKHDSATKPGGGSGQDSILLNIGNHIILQGYQALADAANAMDQSIADFNASPDNTRLATVQNLFKTAYLAWQSSSEYNYFGPASTAQPTLTSVNVFPTSSSRIDANVDANDNNVNTFANTAAKGFPALDYLLFGGDNATILDRFTSDAKAASRKQYLAAVSADIRTEVNAVLNGWLSSGGNYINTFINGSGNSVSSALGLLLNSLNQDFEILKNNRLGVPLGKIPVGAVSPILPNEVEAYYSGISVQLALAQLKAAQNIFLGTGVNGSGPGLDDYLIHAQAKYNGGSLSDTVKAAFEKAVMDMQTLRDPLSQAIQVDPGPANTVFADCQRLVTFLKTDIPSSLGVLITYGDNDGD